MREIQLIMFIKKGKQWALSCVAVSAAVLVGMNATTVHADTTNDSESTNGQVTGTTDAQPSATVQDTTPTQSTVQSSNGAQNGNTP